MSVCRYAGMPVCQTTKKFLKRTVKCFLLTVHE